MNAKNDRKSTAALLAGGVPNTPQTPSRRAVVAATVRVTVELQQSEYDALNEFCTRAKHEAGLGRKVAAAQIFRVLFQLAQADPTIADRVFEGLLTEGPTRHRT